MRQIFNTSAGERRVVGITDRFLIRQYFPVQKVQIGPETLDCEAFCM